ncbi:hypothetical protein LTR20_001064 [Exophiala xenobiotica]|nr:hypothetical protein LTR41_008263 [Exophiala xenobiotica]KAK5374773.1 hypothetical protein LTS13_005341 [Exophiala xenobiotica]KAK5396924.1 hypothetical protein LTR79_005560 [Exophiala xenobiotica]KAK5410667.1 hypothetical protein LTR90_008250 [Exophiala xenobiotica]KAK5470803.1 hypothetical protein LTR20_001064 [Exophiala xenobiotica]
MTTQPERSDENRAAKTANSRICGIGFRSDDSFDSSSFLSTSCDGKRRSVGSAMKPATLQAQETSLEDSPLTETLKMVKLVVGQSPGVTWNLHEERLTSVSQYAKAAMRWPFKEEQERTIRLPEEDPAIFSLFVAYIYGKTELDIPWDEAIRLYVLADRLQAIAFRRKLFCKVFLCFRSFTLAQVEYVLDNTAAGDPLRRACIKSISERTALHEHASPAARLSAGSGLCRKHAPEILAAHLGMYHELLPQFSSDTDIGSSTTNQEHNKEEGPKHSAVNIAKGTARPSKRTSSGRRRSESQTRPPLSMQELQSDLAQISTTVFTEGPSQLSLSHLSTARPVDIRSLPPQDPIRTRLPDFSGEKKGVDIRVAIQMFGSKYVTPDMSITTLGSGNTGDELWRYIARTSGLTQFALYHFGEPLELAGSNKQLVELRASLGVFLVQNTANALIPGQMASECTVSEMETPTIDARADNKVEFPLPGYHHFQWQVPLVQTPARSRSDVDTRLHQTDLRAVDPYRRIAKPRRSRIATSFSGQ